MSGGIGSSLQAARKHLGWTRETLAHHAGVSWSAIAQIESGRRTDVRLPTLVALADALGCTIDSLAGRPVRSACGLFDHRVLLYASDDEFVATAAPFVSDGLQAGEPVLIVTAPRRARLLRAALDLDDGEVEFADSKKWYCSPLSAFNGYRTFLRAKLDDGAPWVRIVGEPRWAGCSDDEVAAWIRYEALLNLALAPQPATIVCPYDTSAVPEAALTGAQIIHPRIAVGAEAVPSASYREPDEFLMGAAL